MFVDNWSKKIRAPSQRDPFGVGAVCFKPIRAKARISLYINPRPKGRGNTIN